MSKSHYAVYRIGERKRCNRCNASAYWVVQDDKYRAPACSAHIGSTIVQGSRRGGVWGESYTDEGTGADG